MKVKDILDSEEKWCRVAMAEDAEGNDVMYDDETACRWCLGAAIALCYDVDWEEHERVKNRVIEHVGDYVTEFNDNARCFAEVRRVIEDLDI